MPEEVESFFLGKLKAIWQAGKFVCIGLDPNFSKLPTHLKNLPPDQAIFEFSKALIDATADLVCAYKIQSAYYENLGSAGWDMMQKTVQHIKTNYPEILVIADAKRGDIGSTNEAYARTFFDNLGFDAITVLPYLGQEALQPFLDRKDKGIFVLVKTSNPGSAEFQDLKVDNQPLYQVVAKAVAKEWNSNKNCGVVVGSTYPEQLKEIRKIIGNMPILIPGIGAQGGDLESAVKNGVNSEGQGIIISASRSIIFASSEKDFARSARQAALKLHQEIVRYLKV